MSCTLRMQPQIFKKLRAELIDKSIISEVLCFFLFLSKLTHFLWQKKKKTGLCLFVLCFSVFVIALFLSQNWCRYMVYTMCITLMLIYYLFVGLHATYDMANSYEQKWKTDANSVAVRSAFLQILYMA